MQKIFAATIFAFAFNTAWAKLDEQALCSSAKICLGLELPICSAEEYKPTPSINYNADFCQPYLELRNRGIPVKSATALQMYSYLGKEFRVIYAVKGELPVNTNMMAYLMDHMPFTAHLINAYQGTRYTLGYTTSDRKNFHGDNGGNLKGKFSWVHADSAGKYSGQRNVFFGYGTAKVLMWKLHGVAVVFLDYKPKSTKSIEYELRSIVFPANGFLNSIMQMDMFGDVVRDRMREIISHIEKSAGHYAKGDRSPIAKSKSFKEIWLKMQLEEFEKVVKGSGYTYGQAPNLKRPEKQPRPKSNPKTVPTKKP